ncbi:phage tail protein [Paenibacillus alvei]|uniref:tail fiber protein n=3 Tax=Paenibacillus alvei TaxID=44250 RepID=UPI00227FB2EB|nr:tail fiber protein [Paenibacillus alvei]MCY9736992.1 phage tail protein [Paenibacillus alvei]MCY9758802.1 phage tail protein [Paenibacillus alvei]
MPYAPTEWKNREVERPRTFRMQNNPDGTVTLLPAEGNIIEPGTPIIAANMNKIEQGIVDAQAALENVAPKQHTHDAKDIVSGIMDATRLPLLDSVQSTSAQHCATANAVKSAYDRANEAFQSASDGKNQVAAAITGKGIPASGSDTYPVLAQKISQITTGVPMARITTSVSEYPKNFLISEDSSTTWGLYYIIVTGLSFQAKGIVVFGENFYSLAAFDFYTNPRISVSGAQYNHQVVYRDTLPLNEWSILATITPNSFIVPVTRYESDSNRPASVIVYG